MARKTRVFDFQSEIGTLTKCSTDQVQAMTTPPVPLYASIERRRVGLHEIKGIDPDVVTGCVEMDLEPDSPIEFEAWDISALHTLDARAWVSIEEDLGFMLFLGKRCK